MDDFFFILLNNLEFIVFGDYWALFLWLLAFSVLILWLWWGNSLMHRVYQKKKKKTIQCIEGQRDIHFSRWNDEMRKMGFKMGI